MTLGQLNPSRRRVAYGHIGPTRFEVWQVTYSAVSEAGRLSIRQRAEYRLDGQLVAREFFQLALRVARWLECPEETS